MQELFRDLHLFADGQEIAQGCHMTLTARETLTLRPAMHHLIIRNLSDSSAACLSGARQMEIRCRNSVLAFGEPVEIYTHQASGSRLTSVVFSPGLSLWQSSVSLSVAAGMKVSDTIRALLAAARQSGGSSSSLSSAASVGSGLPDFAGADATADTAADAPVSAPAAPSLAAFTAQDRFLARPQAFFGRTCDALSLLAEALEADVFLSSAGVCVTGQDPDSARISPLIIPEPDLLSEPIPAGQNRRILVTSLSGWPLGSWIQTSWHGVTYSGRFVSRMIQADNREGPWKSELELILPPSTGNEPQRK